MTRDQARARLADLKHDNQWISRWKRGGAAETREFRELTEAIAGIVPPSKSPARQQLADLQGDWEWVQKFKTGDAAALAEFKSLTAAIAEGESS